MEKNQNKAAGGNGSLLDEQYSHQNYSWWKHQRNTILLHLLASTSCCRCSAYAFIKCRLPVKGEKCTKLDSYKAKRMKKKSKRNFKQLLKKQQPRCFLCKGIVLWTLSALMPYVPGNQGPLKKKRLLNYWSMISKCNRNCRLDVVQGFIIYEWTK